MKALRCILGSLLGLGLLTYIATHRRRTYGAAPRGAR